jgi:predicted membrane channel-forming protein YqfA (hemolysin III family)
VKPGRPSSKPDTEKKLHLVGWVLFILSAIFFTISTLQSGDPMGVLGSLFFLVACLVFIAPLLR